MKHKVMALKSGFYDCIIEINQIYTFSCYKSLCYSIIYAQLRVDGNSKFRLRVISISSPIKTNSERTTIACKYYLVVGVKCPIYPMYNKIGRKQYISKYCKHKINGMYKATICINQIYIRSVYKPLCTSILRSIMANDFATKSKFVKLRIIEMIGPAVTTSKKTKLHVKYYAIIV
jgi:hypothetical protein